MSTATSRNKTSRPAPKPAARPKPAAPAARHDYIADATGWIAGRRVKKGDVLQLTEAQAKYENVTRAKEARPAK